MTTIRRLPIAPLVVLALLATFPLFGPYMLVDYTFYLRVATIALLYVVTAIGLDVALGMAGQFTIAQGAFFGASAYTSAIVSVRLGWSPVIGIALGMLLGAALGFVVGRIALRLHGHYLAILTIGLAVVVQQILLNWTAVTGGPLGLPGIPPLGQVFGLDLSASETFYWFALACGVVAVATGVLLARSKLGWLLTAIREDELAASFVGVDLTRYKVMAFVISAVYAGIAGPLFAHFTGILAPDQFGVAFSALFLIMVTVGGRGAPIWVATAAFSLAVLPEVLRITPTFQQFAYGGLLLLVVLFFPEGLAGLGRRVRGWRWRGPDVAR